MSWKIYRLKSSTEVTSCKILGIVIILFGLSSFFRYLFSAELKLNKVLRVQTSPRFYTAKFAQMLYEREVFGFVMVREDSIEVKIQGECVYSSCRGRKTDPIQHDIERAMFVCSVDHLQ